MSVGQWWERAVLPRIIRCGCGMESVTKLRAEVVPLASGAVFELGCGGGHNQRFYDHDRVTAFAGVDPNAKLREFAGEAADQSGWPGHVHPDVRAGFGEALPFADASFDTVVSTFTLCSVDDPARVLAELRRVLKPGGTFLYLEHGRAPDAGVAKWQRRLEPMWKKVFGNCHLTRPVSAGIAEAGFAVSRAGARYQEDTPRVVGWMEWGTATIAE